MRLSFWLRCKRSLRSRVTALRGSTAIEDDGRVRLSEHDVALFEDWAEKRYCGCVVGVLREKDEAFWEAIERCAKHTAVYRDSGNTAESKNTHLTQEEET